MESSSGASRRRLSQRLGRRAQVPQGALFAEHGNDIMDTRANRRSGKRDADGLSEFAHGESRLLQHVGEYPLDSGFAEVIEGGEFFYQAFQGAGNFRRQKFFDRLFIENNIVREIVAGRVDQLDQCLGAFLQCADHLLQPRG